MPHYEDYAEYYDLDHGGDFDIPFYHEYANKHGPPILELACGTGRILIPLAESGVKIDGLDFSENMLTVCQNKLKERGLSNRTNLFCMNMADFDLPCKEYGLICIPARSFMHLFTQDAQIGCLECSYRHLRPGGVFIVDVYAPGYRSFLQDPDAPFKVTKEYDLPNGNHVVRSDRFVSNDPVMQIQHCERRFQEFSPNGSIVRERVIPMDTRYTFRYELLLLLEKMGFEVQDVFRDYERNPFDGTGEIIVVARKQEF